MIDKELNEDYYKPDDSLMGSKAIIELHKITSVLKVDVEGWVAKKVLW